MDKVHVIQAVISQLRGNLSRLKAANAQAKDGATDSESRAETKWDTSGLEASYLARGYAQQFEQTAKQLEILTSFKFNENSDGQVGMGSLVLTESGGFRDWMFVLPCCGGIELDIDGTEVTIITPESPLATQLLKKRVGSQYQAPGGVTGRILDIV